MESNGMDNWNKDQLAFIAKVNKKLNGFVSDFNVWTLNFVRVEVDRELNLYIGNTFNNGRKIEFEDLGLWVKYYNR